MSLFVVEAIRGRCASFMRGSNCNGLGYIWWTDKCIYFSNIDYASTTGDNQVTSFAEAPLKAADAFTLK